MNIEKSNKQGMYNRMDEIGSEFWLDDLPVESDRNIPSWVRSFGSVVLTSSGRGAISCILENIDPPHKTVLLPSYICTSVIEPFLRYGYECEFYPVDENFQVAAKDLPEFSAIGVFVHTGYFGFTTNHMDEKILAKLKESATIILEDVTHTLFTKQRRFEGNDFVFGSFRKWFGIPDGGFAAGDGLAVPPSGNSMIASLRKEALQLKYRYLLTLDPDLKAAYLKKFAEAEHYLDDDVLPYAIDRASLSLLNRFDIEEMRAKRRKNYNFLYDRFRALDAVHILLPKADKTVCPLFFPVLIPGRRDEVKKRLIDEKIYCPVHWLQSANLKTGDFSEAVHRLYENELSIPCDQRYDGSHMERIVRTMCEIITKET